MARQKAAPGTAVPDAASGQTVPLERGHAIPILDEYCKEFISATLCRVLSGETLESLVGSVLNLKTAAQVLKYVTEYAETRVDWLEALRRATDDTEIKVSFAEAVAALMDEPMGAEAPEEE